MSMELTKELIASFAVIALTFFVFGMCWQIVVTPDVCTDSLSENSPWVIPEGTPTKCGEGRINTIDGCKDTNEFITWWDK